MRKYFKFKKKFTHVFHFAYKKNCENIPIEKYLENNIVYLKKIIKYCIKNNTVLIFPSSACYYPNNAPHQENDNLFPYNLYSFSKICCEKLILREKKLKFYIFRLFNVYGTKGNSFLDKMKLAIKGKRENIIFNENENLERDFVHIDDVINLFYLSLYSKNFGIYNVGSGKFIKLKTLIKRLKNMRLIKNKKIKFKKVYFSPHRPRAVADIKKTLRKFNWRVSKNIYKYFNV